MIETKSFLLILLLSLCGSSIGSEEINRTSENNLEVYEGDVTLGYDFEEKLDKLVESIQQLQQNNNFLMSTIKTIQNDIQLLKEEVQEKSLSTNSEAESEDNYNANLNVLKVECPGNRVPDSCYEVNECKNDVYSIMIPDYDQNPQTVACDFVTDDGGWTVIQRRKDGTVNFNRNWTEYAEGFGHVDGEFFIGLKKLHHLTNQKPQELYIILKDFEGTQRYAKYSNFKIDSEENYFKLTVSDYSGNAGDDLNYHSGNYFSTWDRDNDSSDTRHCAKELSAGWWFNRCYYSNLNGKYLMGDLSNSKKRGLSWYSFRGHKYSLKFSQMMIRPKDD